MHIILLFIQIMLLLHDCATDVSSYSCITIELVNWGHHEWMSLLGVGKVL